MPLTTEPRGYSVVIICDVSADRVYALTLALPGVTRGEGVLTTRLDHFSPRTP